MPCGRTTRDACSSPSRTRCGAGDRPPSPSAVPASKSASTRGTPAGSTPTRSISRCPRATATPSCWPFSTHRGSALRSNRRWSDSTSLATTSTLIWERRSSKPGLPTASAASSPSSWTKDLQATRSRPPPPRPQLRFPPRTRRGTKRSILRSIRTLRRRLRARSSRPGASTTIGSDGRSVATAARCRQTGMRSDIGRSIPMWLRQSRAAGFSADIINISWSGTARGGSAGFSPRIGTKDVISPPIRTRAIGWPRAPTGPAICTMSGSA